MVNDLWCAGMHTCRGSSKPGNLNAFSCFMLGTTAHPLSFNRYRTYAKVDSPCELRRYITIGLLQAHYLDAKYLQLVLGLVTSSTREQTPYLEMDGSLERPRSAPHSVNHPNLKSNK